MEYSNLKLILFDHLHEKAFYFYVALYSFCLVLVATGCQDDLYINNGQTKEAFKDFSMEEAKASFENQMLNTMKASRTTSNGKPIITPGEFTPLWEQATASARGRLLCYDVPIENDIHYKAIYSTYHNGKAKAHTVNLYQKLIVVKK